MNTKAVTVLAVLAAAGIVAAYVAARSGSTPNEPAPAAGAGALLLPDLPGRASEVAQITVKRAPLEFNVKKDGDTWRVLEKANYPAKPDAVRALLVGLSQLRTEEPKTARPEQYAKLGVDDPVPPPADAADKAVPQSALVTLKDGSGKPIGAIILGNPRYGGQSASGANTPELYVRKEGDKQSWLAAGQVDMPREPIGWLETKFADIKRDRVQSISITQPDGSNVTVSHEKQADPFKVRNIPEGRELKDPGVADSLASTLAGLTFQDVAPASSVDPSAAPGVETKPGPTIVVRTLDGLIITIKGIAREAKIWWTISAAADDAIAATLPTDAQVAAKAAEADKASAPPGANTETATPDSPGAPSASPAPSPAPKPVVVSGPASIGTIDALKREVKELNDQWSPYAFSPSDWKVRSINNTMQDLLKEPPAAKPAPGAAPTAPGTPGAP